MTAIKYDPLIEMSTYSLLCDYFACSNAIMRFIGPFIFVLVFKIFITRFQGFLEKETHSSETMRTGSEVLLLVIKCEHVIIKNKLCEHDLNDSEYC